MSDGPSVLIQCVGNPLRRDDGAGPALAERLRQQGAAALAEVREHWGEGTELMQEWEQAGRVILVDAADSDAIPGTIHHFEVPRQSVPKDFCYYSTHRFGVAEAIELARTLGRLPPEMHLYAVEGADFGNGEGLSPAVAGAVAQLSVDIRAMLSGKPASKATV